MQIASITASELLRQSSVLQESVRSIVSQLEADNKQLLGQLADMRERYKRSNDLNFRLKVQNEQLSYQLEFTKQQIDSVEKLNQQQKSYFY